ncbi:MAG TPA: hypothetical protein VKR06_45610, partial [Ktedonosporobacter sp.]|nr:hypothetical protein [Ktedonosporobacter sp.]
MTKNTVSCLSHGDPRFLQVRNDFLAICDANEAEAKILHILEGWTNFKRSRGETSWVLMSCQQFIKESRHTLGETVIYRALNALMKRGYIKRRRNPADLYASRQYRLNLAEIQQALDAHVHNL